MGLVRKVAPLFIVPFILSGGSHKLDGSGHTVHNYTDPQAPGLSFLDGLRVCNILRFVEICTVQARHHSAIGSFFSSILTSEFEIQFDGATPVATIYAEKFQNQSRNDNVEQYVVSQTVIALKAWATWLGTCLTWA